MQLNIVSMVKINGQWVGQEKIPEERFAEMVAIAMNRAGKAIGTKVQKTAS
ncbi:hypothetical protein ACTNEW_01690 [Blautia sp. HCP3S3_G3]|uniref:hypothetical protein n=1 Tax=Blautia sp. HCP3S3_G3 TaxID=3438913 RepID=UPI003F8BB937